MINGNLQSGRQRRFGNCRIWKLRINFIHQHIEVRLNFAEMFSKLNIQKKDNVLHIYAFIVEYYIYEIRLEYQKKKK